jgi:hypothetical protein
MPKIIPKTGTQFKRYSARVQEKKNKTRSKNSHSHIHSVTVDVEIPDIPPKSSHFTNRNVLEHNPVEPVIAGSRVSNVEVISRKYESVAVTPDSPPSPPIMRYSNSSVLFDTLSVLSDEMSDDEEIDEVEEMDIPVCDDCHDQLKKSMKSFLLYGTICHYCSVVVIDHVNMNTKKWEATCFNMERTDSSKRTRYSGEAFHCRPLHLNPISKKKTKQSKKQKVTIDLLCDEELSTK